MHGRTAETKAPIVIQPLSRVIIAVLLLTIRCWHALTQKNVLVDYFDFLLDPINERAARSECAIHLLEFEVITASSAGNELGPLMD